MSSGILNIVNCSSVAYNREYSTYPYATPTSAATGKTVPGYNPTGVAKSHFTVYSQSASTQYYASFILQSQNTSTPSSSIANSVVAVPVYIQECATATVDVSGVSVRQILYHSSVADVTLNAPTNPNSSVYNIFMNMSLFDTVSGAPPGDTSGGSTYPYFKNYTYNGTAPICDVLLTLSAQGKDMETAVFSLSSQQITANSTTSPSSPISTNITASQLGQILLTMNLPISSIFPQISTPGIIFRIKTEIIGYV